MGLFVYGTKSEYHFDDRLLSHVKAVVGSKLRRSEGFLMSWAAEETGRQGRISVWISPSVPIQFRFSGSRPPTLNDHWLRVMAETSFGPRGLIIISEDEANRFVLS